VLALALLLSIFGNGLGDFSAEMTALKGRPVQEAFVPLGYPDDKLTIGSDTVYKWGHDHGRGPSCTFKLVVDEKGIVKSWDGYGNAEGCDTYTKALKRWRRGG
jgi:hypothetical protein